MPFCSACGNQIETTMKYCPKCGKPLGGQNYSSAVPYVDKVMDEEQYLGGICSGDLAKKGGIYGYGIYATNKRIIGMKSRKQVLMYFGLIPLIVGSMYETEAEKEQNKKKLDKEKIKEILKILEEKKDFEISREQISRIEIKMPNPWAWVHSQGDLIITSKSGETTVLYLRNKNITKKVKTLMEAFFPVVTVID